MKALNTMMTLGAVLALYAVLALTGAAASAACKSGAVAVGEAEHTIAMESKQVVPREPRCKWSCFTDKKRGKVCRGVGADCEKLIPQLNAYATRGKTCCHCEHEDDCSVWCIDSSCCSSAVKKLAPHMLMPR